MNADTPKANGRDRGYAIRSIVTIVVIFAYGWINFLLNPAATLATGNMAGRQFENSDAAYVVSLFGMTSLKTLEFRRWFSW